MGGLLLLLCKQLLLPLQFGGERTTDCAPPLLVSVIPKAVVTMPIVRPARMIQDWIQTDSMQRHIRGYRDAGLLPNVTQPARALSRLRSRLGNQHWRSEEHTSELQSQSNLVCRLLLEK